PAPCVAWTIPVGNMPVALAVDTRTQHAFGRNGDGTVSVLDLTRGTPLRTVVVSKPGADAQGLAVDEQTGRVFVAATNYVQVLDATTGALLRTVGGVAPGIAVHRGGRGQQARLPGQLRRQRCEHLRRAR